MAILGAHQSIAGGYHRAAEKAHNTGCHCVQLFTKNNNQWRAKAITPSEAERFHATMAELGIKWSLAHDSYLINLASPDQTLWRRSIDAFIEELHRAAILGIPDVVTHPGAYTSSTEAAGIRRVVDAINEIHAQTRHLATECLLETTAGQGTALGWRFEQFAAILDGLEEPDRLGFCFDTCHVFAAGYRLAPKRAYQATMREFDRLVGLKRIRAFHLNDSRRERGSRVDRHEHIGLGKLGPEPFQLLLADRRFRRVPMYLETPKGERNGTDWDTINLRALRQWAGGSPSA